MKRIRAIFFTSFLLLFGVTTSHAALYFPHVDTTANAWQTEICVINPSATETVQGTLERYNKDTGGVVASMPLSVGPNTRRQINVATELASAFNQGYIVFQNTSGSPVGYTKFTQINGDRVAVPAVDSANTGSIYIPHIAWVPWWTGISLVNTTTEEKTLTIRFNTGVTRTVTLGPKKQYVSTIDGLLEGLLDTTIETAVIENASGIVGLELFGNLPGSGTQLGGVPLTSKTTTTLYYPHVESTGGWWTGIVAYNPSATTTAQITVNSYNMNGTSLGSSPLSLGPGQKFVGYPTTLNLPAGTAWFSLQSQIPLVGFELFGTAPVRLAGYSVVDLEGKSGVFPKVEKNGGWTGIAFVNTENQPATVTVKAYNDTGTVLGQPWVKNLNAHQKLVDVAENLFPGINLSAATYLSFSADRNVAGFQLNGSGSAMLDALPTSTSSGQKIIDKALGFLQYQSTATSGMQAVTDVIGQIISGTNGTCPQVTVDPPNLSSIPPAITITASYGNGCTASDGSTVSGQVVLAITNLTGNVNSGISLDYALTATNLMQNGKVLLNGAVSGHMALNIDTSTSVITLLQVTANFDNFQVADSSISGSMTVDATHIHLSGEAVDVGDITIALNNLTVAGYTASGTLTGNTIASDTFQVAANLNTSQGAVNVTLTVQTPTDHNTIVSTTTPGTIAGYTVTLNNMNMDTDACEKHPISGSVTISQGGSTVTRVFTPSCS